MARPRFFASTVATIAFGAFAVVPSEAAILYVDATGANSGPCTSLGAACRSVTYAMAQASGGSPGDEIVVAPGTYNTGSGETFPIVVKSGVKLRSATGAESTILDAGGAFRRVLELPSCNVETLVEGFTITGGVAHDSPTNIAPALWGGGMSIVGGSPTIRANVFLNNLARATNFLAGGGPGYGGGLLVYSAASPVILNNVFQGNVAEGGPGNARSSSAFGGGEGSGGAIYFDGAGGAIANNTFHQNAAIGGVGATCAFGCNAAGGGASGGAVRSIGPAVVNNIFAGNSSTGGLDGQQTTRQVASSGALLDTNPGTPSNNLFFGNTVNGAASSGDSIGGASVCAAPSCTSVGFEAEPSNLRIKATSPAAGTGTSTGAPPADFDGVTRSTPPSIGAFEPSPADPANPARMTNISARMHVLTGDDVMIGGFVVEAGAKTVAIVATGPSLAAFGVPNPLANPMVTLVRSSDQAVIATNDNWNDAANAAQLQASGFAPSHSLEAAILVNLAPGAYTAVVRGVGAAATGVAVAGVYEVDAATIPLANISARGRVLPGDDAMIGGFVIGGSAVQQVAIVATGPSLSSFGIASPLANPAITLVRSADGAVIDTNDDWQAHANSPALQASGFAPSNALEAAILVTLPPGAYTAIVRGADGGTGGAVIGIYKVN